MSWNQYSDDSWMESDSDSNKQKQQTKQQIHQQSVHQQSNKIVDVKNQQKNGKDMQNKTQQTKQKQKYDKTISKKQSSKKFPTDKQLLQQFQANKIQETKRLKVLNCTQKQQKQVLQTQQKQKNFRLKQYKPNCFVVTFWKSEDLIKFIKQKIQKNYKFKIGEYVVTEKQKQFKAQREKQRAQQRQRQEKQREKEKTKVQYKQKYPRKQQDEKPKQRKQGKQSCQGQRKQYRRQKDDEEKKERKQISKKQSKQYRQKDVKEYQKQHKPKDFKQRDPKQRRKQQQKHDKHGSKHQNKQKKPLNVQRQKERSSKVYILNSDGNPTDIIQWLKQNKIPKQFTQFQFWAPGKLLDYVQKVCQECYKAIHFGLNSQIDEESCLKQPDTIFKFILVEKANHKPIKRTMPCSYISKPNQYNNFDFVDKFNIQVIGNDKNNYQNEVQFDQKDYIELFKKNYQKIVGKWDKWTVYAYKKNIEKLLRLSTLFKKILAKNQFNYEVGRNQNSVPFLKFEVLDLQKTKFKIDTSVINSHIQDSL